MSITATSRGPGAATLALVLHPSYSGYAALDGYGARAFGTSHFPRTASGRASMLARLIEGLVRRVRPARVVLGVPPGDVPLAGALRRSAARLCRRLRVAVVVRPVARALDRLGLPGCPKGRHALAGHLVRNFLPELFTRLRRGLSRFWYRRPAWHASALALSELVAVAPLSAAALVPAVGHRVPAFAAALGAALPRV